MTVKIFVAKDGKGNEWAPDTVHEVTSLEWMLKKAWIEFQRLPMLYCMIVNLRHPSADMVVFTERGFGILELKHSSGEITIGQDGTWYANRERIHAGIHLNPRRQVQKYAEEIRPTILPWLLPADLKKSPERWNELKFQTGICFTNPKARFDKAKEFLAQKRPTPILQWESDFFLISPADFTAWVRELRFQVDSGPAQQFQPVRVLSTTILHIANKVLGATDWKELLSAMPTGEPYGYLILEDSDGRQVFNLHQDESVIGRNPDCDVVIPERYIRVSKWHCKITRGINGITIKDLGSKNGTYWRGQAISTSTRSFELTHNSNIMLGGQFLTEKVCLLRFELHDQTSLNSLSAKLETQ